MNALKQKETLATRWVKMLKSDPDRFREFWVSLTKTQMVIHGNIKNPQDQGCCIYYMQFNDNSFICSRGDECWEADRRPN